MDPGVLQLHLEILSRLLGQRWDTFQRSLSYKINIVITGLNIPFILTVVQIYKVGINEEMLPHCVSKESGALHLS
jgi:hypothetical protein